MTCLIKKYAQNTCFLELNRPEKKNALNKEMILHLIDFFSGTAESDQFRVVVLLGNNRFFSSGADLQWMKDAAIQSEKKNIEEAALFTKLYSTIYRYPKPIISCVEGGAYGGAIGLMACSDITVTTPDSSFAFSETRLGLVPATVAPWIIKKTGTAFAKWAFLTGKTFSGEVAQKNNLAQILLSNDEIIPKTRELAGNIAQNGPDAIKETKQLLNTIDDRIVPIDDDLNSYCAAAIARARTSEQGQEGVCAFFERRKPFWNKK